MLTVLLTAPYVNVTLAHKPPGPVVSCQPGGELYHDYLSAAALGVATYGDGNRDDCGAGPNSFDGEYDHGQGGALLIVNGGDGLTWGGLVCHGGQSHHGGTVYAQEWPAGSGPAFAVSSDYGRNGEMCGDGVIEPCDATPPEPSASPFPVNVAEDTVNAMAWGASNDPGVSCNTDDCSQTAPSDPFGPSSLTPTCGAGIDGAYHVAILPDVDAPHAPAGGHVWTSLGGAGGGAPIDGAFEPPELACAADSDVPETCAGAPETGPQESAGTRRCGTTTWIVKVRVRQGDGDVMGSMRCGLRLVAACNTGTSNFCKGKGRSNGGRGECELSTLTIRTAPLKATVTCYDPLYPQVSVTRDYEILEASSGR